MILGAIGEWIVGNTFPFVVFGTFGKLSFPNQHTISRERTAALTATFFPALQAPSGSPTAAPSSHLSTPTEPTSPTPHKWQARMETLETRSVCRHRGSTLPLRSSLSLWVRLNIPNYIYTESHFYTCENGWEQDKANAEGSVIHRTHLLHLPHLLPPHQRRLLPHLPHARRRLWLPRGRVLESRARV